MSEPVAVRVADCGCPDTPHAEGHLVYLRPKVSLELGTAAQQSRIRANNDGELLTRLWLEDFVRYGVTGTNWLVSFDVQSIIDDYEISGPVADKAADLYADVLLRPLGVSLSPTSSDGQTAGSTSPTKKSRRPSPA